MNAGSLSGAPGHGFWDVVAGRCSAMFSTLQQWRGSSVLALGESFGDVSEAGKAAQVVHRLSRLNPALRVVSHCAASQDLAGAGRAAAAYGRRSFDAALVFIGPAQLEAFDEQENFADAAEHAMAAIARVSRGAFLVTAFDGQTQPGLPQSAILARRKRWLERTLQHVCARHGVAWVPLLEEEGCVVSAGRASHNFSVDGFRPVVDPHEMWTARMLEQPALAQLVFH